MDTEKPIKNAIQRKYPAVGIDDNLETALKAMAEHNSSALVVEVGGDLVGIVTITDVMYCLANGRNCEETEIRSFMTKCDLISGSRTKNPCAQLDEQMDALAAVKVMYEAGTNHLLVSGAGGEPVGMVSSLEIIKLLAA